MILSATVVLIGEEADDGAWRLANYFGFQERDIVNDVIWWLSAIFLSSLTGGFLLSRFVTRPLTRLAGVARLITGGDLACRVAGSELKRGDEIGDLARGFNQMADSLVGLLENERRLIRDISHDLRSPLGRIRVSLAVIAEKSGGHWLDNDLKYLRQMDKDVAWLENLLNQTLEQARLETTRRLGVEKAQLNLTNLVASGVRDYSFKVQAENKKITVVAPESVVARGHEETLKRALDNLLNNAVAHTVEGGEIMVSLRQLGSEIILEVADQGPGVPTESLRDIFKPFFRADQARALERGGFGLGLSIVRQVAELHKGRVEAANILGTDNEPMGLRISFYLPNISSD
jgi:two-component system sensor histidine kinase CpxA